MRYVAAAALERLATWYAVGLHVNSEHCERWKFDFCNPIIMSIPLTLRSRLFMFVKYIFEFALKFIRRKLCNFCETVSFIDRVCVRLSAGCRLPAVLRL